MNRPTKASLLHAIAADPFAAVADFYAERLSDHPKAVAFIEKELGLTPQQAAELQIGFSDRTLGKHLPRKDSRAGRELRGKLIEVGLYKSSGHETLRGCLTIPLLNDAGNVSGIYGRRIDRRIKEDTEITIGTGKAACSSCETSGGVPPEPACVEPVQSTADDDDLAIGDNQITFVRDDRRYRIRGLERNTNACTLKVNLMVSRDGLVHLDTLDLVKARSRASFIKAAANELFVDAELVKRDIGQLLLKLETLRERQIEAARAPQVQAVELTEQETEEALALLRDPELLNRIVADMDACGMVGESTNKLAGYLAATSRKLAQPLAIVIQSSSSAGKTSLMDAVLAMMPDEEVLRFSGMTGQSLFYLSSDEIKHRILAISEEEGIAEATYALKLLQSEGELRHATVGRDESGKMVTQQHHVEGPVQIMLTTTAMDVDEELVNRCLLLSVDESRNQTGAIQAIQRKTKSLEKFVSQENAKRLRKLHQNAQRLLKPLRVFNPYASQLTFPNNKTRLRRDHQKYLTLIDTIALLRQHQRTVHSADVHGHSIEYINVTADDIAVAGEIAGEVLGRSLDELSPQTRRLLGLLHDFVGQQTGAVAVARHAFRFTRRDVREAIGWSDFQIHKHLTRLVDLEYLLVHRGHRGRRYVYELLYGGEGAQGEPFLMGLIDPARLTPPPATTTTSSP